ncbi:hypothetical protein [Thalassococcus sp. S3]|uniref:hypothetical protein n=1 Tax=Thalassococcus sp. S3 TaxID=2017482 RepID=UPI0010248EE6|nr:hypothetical protein [Thalassococcus sp. S3]QBF34269.1 hypothetical protein CFI11_24090 [Thalassococcus sp. S3]
MSPDETILLSAETIYRLEAEDSPAKDALTRTDHYLDRLAEWAEPFETEIALCLRRPDTFMESLYKTISTSWPETFSFETFLASYPTRFDYRRRLDAFRARFRVTVTLFEDLQPGVIEGFFRAHDLPAPTGFSAAPVRVGIAPAAALWLMRAKTEATLSNQARRRRWLFTLQTETQPLFHAATPGTLWSGPEARDRFLNAALESVPDLRFPPAGPLPPPARWSDADHAAAEARFAHWENHHQDWLAAREADRIPPHLSSQAPGQA